jgi:hypothetical protein
LLDRAVKRRGGSFKDTVNEALRRGLDAMATPTKSTPYRVVPFHLGGSRVGSLDNVEEVLSRAEGEDHR